MLRRRASTRGREFSGLLFWPTLYVSKLVSVIHSRYQTLRQTRNKQSTRKTRSNLSITIFPYRPRKRIECHFLPKTAIIYRLLSRFRLLNWFKSTCNKARQKSLFVLNSTAGRRRQAKSTRPDFRCPIRLGSTYWGRLPGLLVSHSPV